MISFPLVSTPTITNVGDPLSEIALYIRIPTHCSCRRIFSACVLSYESRRNATRTRLNKTAAKRRATIFRLEFMLFSQIKLMWLILYTETILIQSEERERDSKLVHPHRWNDFSRENKREKAALGARILAVSELHVTNLVTKEGENL